MARPPYHLHLAGVQLAGGRGHGELDFLAVLGVHGGRGGRWGWGALGSGSGATLPAGLARAGRGAEATAGWLVSGEEEGCVRTDKNTERGEGRAREEGSPPACPPPCPSCPRARPPSSNRSSVPSRLHPRAPRLAGLCVSASLCLPLLSLSVFKCHSSVSPPFPISHSFSPRLSLSLPLSPSLPVSPLWPQPWGPQSVPSPETGARGLMGGLRRKWPMSTEKSVLPGRGRVGRAGRSRLGAPCCIPRT